MRHFRVQASAATVKAPARLMVIFVRKVEPIMQDEIRDLVATASAVDEYTFSWVARTTFTVAVVDGWSNDQAMAEVQKLLDEGLTFN